MALKTFGKEKGKVCVARAEVPEFMVRIGLLTERSELFKRVAEKELDRKAIQAVREENKGELLRLLKAGAGKGEVDESKNTLVGIAAWEGRIEMVRLLLQHDFVQEELFTKDQLILAHYYACRAGHGSLAELIRLYADEKQ